MEKSIKNLGQVGNNTLKVVSKKPALSEIQQAIQNKMFDVPFDGIQVYIEGFYTNNDFKVNVGDVVFEFHVRIDLDEIFIDFKQAFNESNQELKYEIKDQYIIENYLEEVLINETG